MAERGGQPGNTNAVGGAPKPFLDALNRAIKQTDGKKLRAAAEKLLDLAAEGEPWAIKELADRTDGKAQQSNTVEFRGQTLAEAIMGVDKTQDVVPSDQKDGV